MIPRLQRYTPLFFCFTTGALLALAFAPYHFLPALWLALPPLFLALEQATIPRASIARAFAFGYGFSIAGTSWIANALLVDAEQFGWLYPICVLGLSALMATFFALFGALYWQARTPSPVVNAVRFAVLWVGVEYLRSLGMMGFPWNLLGSAALTSPALAQPIALLGTYGMSLLLALAALAPALWRTHPRLPLRARMGYSLAALALLIGAYGYGMARLPALSDVPLTPTRLRLVQANIAQSMKWTERGAMESMELHRAMTMEPAPTGSPAPTLILWPETALPFTLFPHSNLPEKLAEFLPHDSYLLTGALRVEGNRAHEQLFNSFAAIHANGRLEATYDKHHLVPFGEFIPLEHWLPLERITHGKGAFTRGAGPQTLTLGPSIPPFSPLICYEVIFPWESVHATHRPDWILNLTNDAWYGDSAGPYQHFDAARLRALEQGLPVVRVANTGISAILDPYGRPHAQMRLGQRGFLDGNLPAPLPPTPYAEWGEGATLALLLTLWGGTLLYRKKAPRVRPMA